MTGNTRGKAIRLAKTARGLGSPLLIAFAVRQAPWTVCFVYNRTFVLPSQPDAAAFNMSIKDPATLSKEKYRSAHCRDIAGSPQ